jgi:chaperonin cofactor prefoldin
MDNNKDDFQKPDENLFPAKVEAKLSTDLFKNHGSYLSLIKEVSQHEVSEDNFEKSQELNKKIIKFLNYVEDHRKDEKNPYLEAGRLIDAAHKKVSTPLEDAKNQLQAKINVVGKRMEAEAQKVKREQERIDLLKNGINAFILDSSAKIAAATTTEQLISIERLINLEKANKVRYQDHLPLLIERSNELTTKIKEQKDLVKELERVEEEKKQALETGNDEKAQDLLEKSALLEAKIEENTILVQETASKSVILTEIVAPEIDMPNTRRKAWKFEVVDIKETAKKRPDLVDMSLNNKAVSEVLKTLKDTGVLNGKTEFVLNGIRFFQDINY